MHLPLLLPLAAAFLYAAAALCVKIALGRGIGTLEILLRSNFVLAALFLPLAAFGHGHWQPAHAWWALLAGLLFFLGQVGTFRSLQSGDVSIATPALAAKVVFVALLSLPVPGNRPDPDLWLAVGLTMAGMLLLHRGPARAATRPLATLAWALSAALSFAAADVIVQTVAPRAGFTLFMPVMFATVAAISTPLLVPHQRRPRTAARAAGAGAWATAGVTLIGLQAVAVGTAIGVFGNATGVNVVYSSRGLWSLVLLALVARYLGLHDSVFERRTLLLRLLGSILILAAVALVLF